MTRKFVVVVAMLAAAAVPTIAQASSPALTRRVARTVERQWGSVVRNRGRLTGIRVTAVHVSCRATGGFSWACYGTYVGSQRRQHYKYGAFIDARRAGNSLRWRVVGKAMLLRRWRT